jgi:hypothetical protein
MILLGKPNKEGGDRKCSKHGRMKIEYAILVGKPKEENTSRS